MQSSGFGSRVSGILMRDILHRNLFQRVFIIKSEESFWNIQNQKLKYKKYWTNIYFKFPKI